MSVVLTLWRESVTRVVWEPVGRTRGGNKGRSGRERERALLVRALFPDSSFGVRRWTGRQAGGRAEVFSGALL